MSTLAYAALTTKCEVAHPGTSTSSSPPGVKSYMDALAALVPVTTKRILMTTGFIRRGSLDILLSRVESLQVNQGVFGRILGYGTVVVAGRGSSRQPFRNITRPLDLRHKVQEQLGVTRDARGAQNLDQPWSARMHSRHRLRLSCAAVSVLLLTLGGLRALGAQAAAQAARRGPPAFDTSLVRLRPQYHGDDLAVIYRAYGGPKGEFETTAQFQRRVANAPSPRPFAFLLVTGGDLTMQYNADAAELTVHLHVECQGGANGGNIGELIARSSFASNRSRLVGAPDYSLLVSCPEGEFPISYPVHLEPGAAGRAQGHIGAVLVGEPALLPEGGYTRLEHGRDLHKLHITPLSLWMVNTSTGEVLNKRPFTRVRQ